LGVPRTLRPPPRKRAAPGASAPRSVRRFTAESTAPWAGCIDLLPFHQSVLIMAAQSEALNDQIKQSIALLRRHL
jgi:hypothetical protein